MIEVKVRFWTNDLADEKGRVLPRHAWSSGVVRVESNKTHGSFPGSPRPFHSMLDLNAVVERVLIEHGVVLHPSRRMRKYFGRGNEQDDVTNHARECDRGHHRSQIAGAAIGTNTGVALLHNSALSGLR